MGTFLTVVHVIVCIFLILVVLLQSGKGAEVSSTLAGSSQTIFGSSGGVNFFVKFTGVLAAIFMATSLGLTLLNSISRKSLFETTQKKVEASAPVSPTSTPDASGQNYSEKTNPAAKPTDSAESPAH